MDFQLLGPLEVRAGESVYRPAGKQGAVLALLLLDAGRVVGSDRIVDELWGDSPPESATKALNVFVWRLRKAVPGLPIAKLGRGFILELAPGDRLDLQEFERLVAEGRRALGDGDPARAAETTAAALALWRGTPLAELDEPFAVAEASRLEEMRLDALEQRIEAEVEAGDASAVIAELEALVARHPLREKLHSLLMLALYRSGRQAEALGAYQDARRLLIDELGIEPGPALRELERAVLRHDPRLDRVAPSRTARLPAELTSFVGREQELERLRALLLEQGTKLITLTGAGGSGKTRVALRAARQLADGFDNGVVFVELGPLTDAALVAPAMAQALGVRETDGPLIDGLVTHLRRKEMLLVLDNFEHVTAAALDVARLLASCERLRVLVTSRVPLHLPGEHELAVAPLAVPSATASPAEVTDFASVELFVERARTVRDDFRVDETNAAEVGAICARLDGLPLAIELAAARVRLLSPQAVLSRLERTLDDLGDSGDGRPSRQRTLRSSIAWSHDLLSEAERVLFRRLAVFRGGFTLAAAEELGRPDAFAALTTLVEHGLVSLRSTAEGESRFELLETIAEFARERLAESGELTEIGRRHASFFVAFAEEAETHLYSDARRPWLLRITDERDNIRAALAWSEEHDEAQLGLRILAALWLVYWASFNEGLEWAGRLLPLPSALEPTAVRAGALFTGELCAVGAGDVETLVRYGEEAAAVARAVGDDRRLALALALLSGVVRDDPEQVLANCDEALEVAARAGDEWVHAWMNMTGGVQANLIGRPDEAKRRAEQAVRRFDELGDSWSRSSSAMSLGIALLQLQDLDAARAALDGAVEALLAVGDLKMANGCLLTLATTERLAGDAEAAERLYEEAFELCIRAGDPANVPACLEGIAAVSAARDPRRSARLLGAARALADEGGRPTVPFFDAFHRRTRDALGMLLDGELDALLAAGGQDAARGEPLTPASAPS